MKFKRSNYMAISEKELFLHIAGSAYKVSKLIDTPGMDEFALRLNAQPTRDEQQHVDLLWRIFENLGAVAPEKIKEGVTAFNMQKDLAGLR